MQIMLLSHKIDESIRQKLLDCSLRGQIISILNADDKAYFKILKKDE